MLTNIKNKENSDNSQGSYGSGKTWKTWKKAPFLEKSGKKSGKTEKMEKVRESQGKSYVFSQNFCYPGYFILLKFQILAKCYSNKMKAFDLEKDIEFRHWSGKMMSV